MKHELKVSSRVALGALVAAIASTACSGTTKDGDKKQPLTDAGGKGGSANSNGPSEWKMMGYDPEGTFHNRAETKLSVDNVGTLKLLWEKDSLATSNGTPIIAGDAVYVLTNGNKLYAFNKDDGTELWTSDKASGSASMAYDDGVLYFNGNGQTMIALDATSGAELWSKVVDDHGQAFAFSSPIISGDYVVVGSSSIEETLAVSNATFRGAVVAYDKKTGEQKWKTYTVDPPYNGCAIWSTVAVDGPNKLVYAGTGNNYTEQAGPTSDSIFAINLDDGKVSWMKQATTGDVFTIFNPKSPDTDFGADPIIYEYKVAGETRKLVAEGQKSSDVWIWDRITGEQIATRKLGKGSANIGGVFISGAFDGEQLLFLSNRTTSEGEGSEPSDGQSGTAADSVSTLFALDPATLDIKWERQLPAWGWGPIPVANGVGYVGYEQTMQAFDVKTGKKLYEYKATGTITAAPAIADGRVYFPSGMTYTGGHPAKKFQVLAPE